MAQTLGIVDVVWRGRTLDVERGASVKLAGTLNTAVVAGRRVHRAESFEAGEVKATMVLKRGDRIAEVDGPREGELTVLCDTGQTYTWPDAFLTVRPMFTGGEGGKMELTWAVGEGEELLNG